MLTYEEISKIQCKDLFVRKDLDQIVDTIFRHWRANGFPYYDKRSSRSEKEIKKLYDFDTNDLLLPDNHLQQYMLGLSTANSFHPQMWSIRCNGSKSPMDVFMDDEALKTAILKRIKYGNDAKFAPYLIRKSIKIFGSQSVSNFRPTIAKWVYDNFSDGDVLDPCAGYGGRLFGAYCSNKVKSYVGVDPSTDTFWNNMDFARYLGEIIPFKPVTMINNPFEDVRLEEKFSLVFTSPPYFDTEHYTDFGRTQSYIRYPKYETWVKGFLHPLIENSNKYLKEGGYMVLNVGQQHKNKLYDDTMKIANKLFGEPQEIYYMRLSRIMGGNKGSKGHKVEPIIVWKK